MFSMAAFVMVKLRVFYLSLRQPEKNRGNGHAKQKYPGSLPIVTAVNNDGSDAGAKRADGGDVVEKLQKFHGSSRRMGRT
jgi:hypothetical protein